MMSSRISPGWCLRRCRRALGPIAIALILAPPAAAQDNPTTGTAESRRVRLQPVLRPREDRVRLDPVLRGQKPEPQSTPAPRKEKPPERIKVEPEPDKTDSTAPDTSDLQRPVRQPPLPNPLGPGRKPSRTPEQARAAERISAAQALLDEGEINQARRHLFELALEIHGAPEAAEALMMAALALDDIEQTRAELREIVRAYPAGEVSRRALARMGDLSFILGNYEDSITAYREFRRLARTSEDKRKADIRIALALLRSERYEAALQALEAINRDYPDLKETPDLLETRAEALMAIGRIAEADAQFEALERGFPNYQSAAKVLLNRGLCAELLGNVGTARRQYTIITEEYPGSLEAGLAAGRLEDLEVPLLAGAFD